MIGNSLLLGDDGGYNLTRSLRFRQSASAYLLRTPATTTNQTTFTFSLWFKTSVLNTSRFYAGRTGTNFPAFGMMMNSSGIVIDQYTTGGSLQFQLVSSAVYRDPCAWYHFSVAFDTTQATAANRIKVYVNGQQVTSFSTANYPAQNLAINVNTATNQYIGADPANGAYFDCYMAEVNFIDGQALTPSSFGAFSIYNQWLPKKYAGTYGTNGFYLPFTNNASAATLGNDFSGNSNTWTTNNISVTAGSTYDSMTDVPTLTSATAANFAVMNPLWKDAAVVIKDGNLNVSNGNYGGISTIAMPTGSKFYCEVIVTATQGNQAVGLVKASAIGTAIANIGLFGSSAYGYYATSGQKYVLGAASAYGASWGTIGDVIGIAADLSANTLTFYKNNTSQGAITIDASIDYVFGVSNATATGGVAFNFGQRPFTYTPPTGYLALNTFNL